MKEFMKAVLEKIIKVHSGKNRGLTAADVFGSESMEHDFARKVRQWVGGGGCVILTTVYPVA